MAPEIVASYSWMVVSTKEVLVEQEQLRDAREETLASPAEDSKPVAFARGTGNIPLVDAGTFRDEDVAAIAHDLRNPVSVIDMEVAMLEEKLPAMGTDARDALARIGRNLKYLDNLLQDLLDLSAIDAARLQLHCESTELCGLVAEVVERMVPTRDRGRVRASYDGVIRVYADANRIARVIANLLQNALKYSARGAKVTVLVERYDFHARVSVIDEGAGLTPEDARCVFEKFKRAATAKRHDGVGLGLFVSRRIVEAHHGTISVDSALGRGSRFFFDLPLEEEAMRI